MQYKVTYADQTNCIPEWKDGKAHGYSTITGFIITNTVFKAVAYVDSMDWKDYGIDGILNEVVSNDDLGSGSIILLHNGTKYTVDALDEIIAGIKDQGYELVPVSQLIYTGEYTVDQTGRQFEK